MNFDSINLAIPYASFILALILMLFVGSPMIRSLKVMKGAKWAPREDTPDSHLQKAGVPSMGGLGIIGSALGAWLLLNLAVFIYAFVNSSTTPPPIVPAPSYASILLAVFAFVSLFPLIVFGHMILGYIDDLSKAMKRGGITSKQKLVGQIILAATFLLLFPVALSLISKLGIGMDDAVAIKMSWVWPIALLVIIGTSNAVNLTDGIDGLAAGLSVQVAIAFLVIGWGQPAGNIPAVVMFWMCLGGSCLGFLAFNKNPAKVFMGDTGSLALGAALGIGAILTKTVFLLPFIGFIFFVEMFSVMSQVAYFKYTKKKFGEGKRIFRRAPLHHHFELGGWREWKVVGTFWAVNAVTTIIGLILWKAGVLPKFPF